VLRNLDEGAHGGAAATVEELIRAALRAHRDGSPEVRG